MTEGAITVNTLTIHDSDPTVVSLARTGTGAVREGATVEFTVSLGRALVAGEVVDVPLAVSGTGVTPADWSLALKAGAGLNTGVTLSRADTATPRLRFADEGAETATLELVPVDDGVDEGGETYTVALGPDGTGANGFDHPDLGTNLGRIGADPHPTRDLAASDSDVTRLRVGLEGSYHVALENGGSLVPKLELGARHDGGDAETGFGVELGGGVKWTDPGLGLMLDLSGRTLIAHGNDDLKDRGFSAALAYDPAPATKRGASLSLRQDFGGKATGGLDALFQPATLDDRTGSEATSRWALEAAWGLPAFGGRWTGSPHVGLGLATGARDYSVGWRLTPEGRDAPDLSFGLKATRRESATAAPEHALWFEARLQW